jgi:hypothetical protein
MRRGGERACGSIVAGGAVEPVRWASREWMARGVGWATRARLRRAPTVAGVVAACLGLRVVLSCPHV